MIKKIVFFLTFIIAFGAIALATSIKSVRILAPQAFGLQCVTETVCLDDVNKREEAMELLVNAKSFVRKELGAFNTEPTVLFCSTTDCFDRFSDPIVSAQYYWGARTILLSENWAPYILRHELIHHWQNDNFGGPHEALRLPMWFLEGMAYTLSGDPRDVIPNAEANAQRERFMKWQSDGNDWHTPPQQ